MSDGKKRKWDAFASQPATPTHQPTIQPAIPILKKVKQTPQQQQQGLFSQSHFSNFGSVSPPQFPHSSLGFGSPFQFLPVSQGSQNTHVNTIVQTQQLPSVQPPPRVKFRIDENGKVRYAAREKDSSKNYMEMSSDQFKIFKGGGQALGQPQNH